MAVREYFLPSSRLGFSIWTHTDLPLAFELWGDPEVTGLTGGPFTAQQVRERLEREIKNHEEHRVQYWPIFLLETGEHVGCCGFSLTNRRGYLRARLPAPRRILGARLCLRSC